MFLNPASTIQRGLSALLLGSALICVLTTSASAQLTPRQIAARAEPALVAVTAFDSDGQEIRRGSGFFVGSNGYVVTNVHVVEGARRVEVITDSGDTIRSATVRHSDPASDIAILHTSHEHYGLDLGSDAVLAPGDRIFVIGNPLGLTATFSDGVISSRRQVDETEYLQFTAPVSPGSSGGPLLDDRGHVVGIVTLLVSGGQNLNLAVAVKHLTPIVASVDPSVRSSGGSTTAAYEILEVLRRASEEQWVSVERPDGVYELWTSSPTQPNQGTFVLYSLPIGERMLGLVSYDPARIDPGTGGVLHFWVDSPTTVTRNGAVAMVAGEEREGGFVSQDQIVVRTLDTVGGEPESWILTRKRERLLESTGLYQVRGGAGRDPWAGSVAIIDSGLAPSPGSSESIIAAALSVRAEDQGQEYSFIVRGTRARDGSLRFERTEVAGYPVSLTGSLVGASLELTIYTQVTDDLYRELHVRGAKAGS